MKKILLIAIAALVLFACSKEKISIQSQPEIAAPAGGNGNSHGHGHNSTINGSPTSALVTLSLQNALNGGLANVIVTGDLDTSVARNSINSITISRTADTSVHNSWRVIYFTDFHSIPNFPLTITDDGTYLIPGGGGAWANEPLAHNTLYFYALNINAAWGEQLPIIGDTIVTQ